MSKGRDPNTIKEAASEADASRLLDELRQTLATRNFMGSGYMVVNIGAGNPKHWYSVNYKRDSYREDGWADTRPSIECHGQTLAATLNELLAKLKAGEQTGDDHGGRLKPASLVFFAAEAPEQLQFPFATRVEYVVVTSLRGATPAPLYRLDGCEPVVYRTDADGKLFRLGDEPGVHTAIEWTCPDYPNCCIRIMCG